MSPQDVIDRMTPALVEHGVDPEAIAPGLTVTDLPLDSLEWVNFSLQLEEEFKVDIKDAELLGCETLGDIANLVAGKAV